MHGEQCARVRLAALEAVLATRDSGVRGRLVGAGSLAALTGNVNERGMLLLFPVYEVLLQVGGANSHP